MTVVSVVRDKVLWGRLVRDNGFLSGCRILALDNTAANETVPRRYNAFVSSPDFPDDDWVAFVHEDFEFLDSFTPYSLPFVHRAVFMAVPHKGAEMAQSPLGRLGAWCITLPKAFARNEATITRIGRELVPDQVERQKKLPNRFYTGIDNLDPGNPFVLANGSSPLKEDLTFHCVIGNSERAGAPDGSDGVVPYWSSHLDNAASELIVKSNHSVHRRPAAMQELLRILLLHLKEARK